MEDPISQVTQLLNEIDGGDRRAAAQLLPLVYDELRRLAAARLAKEAPGNTLDATALVHEAYLRLAPDSASKPGRPSAECWENRRHFFAAAAEAMRRILIESARRKLGPKQGGGRRRLNVDLDAHSVPNSPVDLLALDEALNKLAVEAPMRAELVKLRFFAGLTMPEAAKALGISLATAERYWTFARTWLYAELCDAESSPEGKKSGND